MSEFFPNASEDVVKLNNELFDSLRRAQDHEGHEIARPSKRPRRPGVSRKRTEHEIQAALIRQCDELGETMPEFMNIYSIPNGGRRGLKDRREKVREGLRKGVPDLFWAFPSGRFHGFYIEMKRPGGVPRQEQLQWLERLSDAGYATCFFDDEGEAIETMLIYRNDVAAYEELDRNWEVCDG
jgi:hypothetical protein